MTGIETPITIIIADFAQSDSIVDCLKNLNSWSPKKILVSNDLNAKDRLRDDFSYNFIFHESQNIHQLWEQGLASSETKWNLIISSNEIVTGHLKNSIESKIKDQLTTEKLFKIKKKIVFLKKVLKYPLEWPTDFSSCLVFIHHKDNFILKAKPPSKSPLLQGELIQFSSPTIEDGIKEIFGIAEIESDKLFLLPEPPKLTTLTVKTFFKFIYAFFSGLIFKKGFKEGYEGIIFSAMNSMVPLLTLFRYFEKYHRSGKKIESKLNQIKNILVVKVRGAGDLILSTPFLRNLKELLPHAKIHVLATEGSTPLLDNNPYIQSITKIEHECKPKAIKEILPKLKNLNIDLAINLEAASRTSKLLRKIPSEIKIDRSYYFRDKNTDALIGFTNTYRSVIERELDILRAIGLKPINKHTEIFLTEKEIQWAKNFLESNNFSFNKKIILVSPFSSLEIRDWGIENYALLCKNLSTGDDIQIIVNAAPKEVSDINKIKSVAPKTHIFSGTLRELLALINESDLLIGSDSGPTQFSMALNIPTITMNGPSVSSFYRDPELFQSPHYTFNNDVPCRDLLHTQCFSNMDITTQRPICNEMICLDFSVDEVSQKAREIILMNHKA
jgi:ADP-heptose:LPS heptosyltransferase